MARTSKWRFNDQTVFPQNQTLNKNEQLLHLDQSCDSAFMLLSKSWTGRRHPKQCGSSPGAEKVPKVQQSKESCRISRIGQAMLQDWWKAEPWPVAGAAGTLSPCPKVEPCTQCAKMMGCLPANQISCLRVYYAPKQKFLKVCYILWQRLGHNWKHWELEP